MRTLILALFMLSSLNLFGQCDSTDCEERPIDFDCLGFCKKYMLEDAPIPWLTEQLPDSALKKIQKHKEIKSKLDSIKNGIEQNLQVILLNKNCSNCDFLPCCALPRNEKCIDQCKDQDILLLDTTNLKEFKLPPKLLNAVLKNEKVKDIKSDISVTKYQYQTLKNIIRHHKKWNVLVDYNSDILRIGTKPAGAKIAEYRKKIIDAEKKLTGKGFFNLDGNETHLTEFFNFGAGITMERGTYPSQLNILAEIKMRLEDGEFQENVSKIHISYDWHYPKLNNAASRVIENFVFASRFSNDYLGIDQKYEIGAGVIFNYWTRSMTAKGKAQLAKLHYFGFVDRYYRNLTVKKFSILRLAALVGIYYEFEQITAKDSVGSQGQEVYRSESLSGTNNLRWEVRPTLEIRPSDPFLIKVFSYFKLPVPWDWQNELVSAGGIQQLTDYFIELGVSFKVVNLFERMGLEFQYSYYYDNYPRNMLVDVGGTQFLLKAPQQHQSFSIKFDVKF